MSVADIAKAAVAKLQRESNDALHQRPSDSNAAEGDDQASQGVSSRGLA